MHCKSYSHFFSKKFQHICVSFDVNFNESLTNDIVSFEQLGPDNSHKISGLIYWEKKIKYFRMSSATILNVIVKIRVCYSYSYFLKEHMFWIFVRIVSVRPFIQNISQRAHDVYTTSPQRRCNVMTYIWVYFLEYNIQCFFIVFFFFFCIISDPLSPLVSQTIIITNFKQHDC